MTVAELMEMLAECEPDAPVYVAAQPAAYLAQQRSWLTGEKTVRVVIDVIEHQEVQS